MRNKFKGGVTRRSFVPELVRDTSFDCTSRTAFYTLLLLLCTFYTRVELIYTRAIETCVAKRFQDEIVPSNTPVKLVLQRRKLKIEFSNPFLNFKFGFLKR